MAPLLGTEGRGEMGEREGIGPSQGGADLRWAVNTHIHKATRQMDKFVLNACIYGHAMYEGQTTRTLLNTRQSKFNENTFHGSHMNNSE